MSNFGGARANDKCHLRPSGMCKTRSPSTLFWIDNETCRIQGKCSDIIVMANSGEVDVPLLFHFISIPQGQAGVSCHCNKSAAFVCTMQHDAMMPQMRLKVLSFQMCRYLQKIAVFSQSFLILREFHLFRAFNITSAYKLQAAKDHIWRINILHGT